MRQTIILIVAIIISATTCNAQGWQGFARRAAKAATTPPKVLNKYRTPIVTGIVVGATNLSNQRDGQLHTPNARLPHPYLPQKGVLASTVVTKIDSVKTIHPCAAALSIDSLNLHLHRVMTLPTDTTHNTKMQ